MPLLWLKSFYSGYTFYQSSGIFHIILINVHLYLYNKFHLLFYSLLGNFQFFLIVTHDHETNPLAMIAHYVLYGMTSFSSLIFHKRDVCASP